MAIINSYSNFNFQLDTRNPAYDSDTDNDSEFGENQTRNITAINAGAGSSFNIVNNYGGLYTNKFSATAMNSRNEQILIQSMVGESIFANGVTVRYMPRWMHYVDDVFNEAPDATFSKGYLWDVVIKSAAGFEGEGDVLTQYGMEFKEEFEFVISIPKFQELHKAWYDGLATDELRAKFKRGRPLEGDLVVVPFGRAAANTNQYFPKVFEILHVTTFHDGAFFQVGDNYQYKIKARLFDLSAEDLEFSPTVVDRDGQVVVSEDTGPIARAKEANEILDDKGNFNIPGSEVKEDTWSKNTEIEQNAQQQEKFHINNETEKTDRLTDDYTAKLFGMNGVIDDLSEI